MTNQFFRRQKTTKDNVQTSSLEGWRRLRIMSSSVSTWIVQRDSKKTAACSLCWFNYLMVTCLVCLFNYLMVTSSVCVFNYLMVTSSVCVFNYLMVICSVCVFNGNIVFHARMSRKHFLAGIMDTCAAYPHICIYIQFVSEAPTQPVTNLHLWYFPRLSYCNFFLAIIPSSSLSSFQWIQN